MPVINYALKYASKVDERFKLASLTEAAVNQDYDWQGVKSVRVYSIPTVPMGNYTRKGSGRYGNPQELGDFVQEMTVTQDRSFTFTIDKGNETEQMGAKEAGKALRRQIDEVVIPEIDKYRLSRMAAKAGGKAAEVVVQNNAYNVFLDGSAALTEKKVPLTGRVAFVGTTYYKRIKQDTAFIKSSDLGMRTLIKGQVGEIDGIRIVQIPDSYLPADVSFIITQKIATVSPKKLQEYKTHRNPPGINGDLVEGRVLYDAFVLDEKVGAIYVHYSKAAANLVAAPTITYAAAPTNTITLATTTSGSTIKYTVDGADPRDATDAKTYTVGTPISTATWESGAYRIRAYATKDGSIDSVVTDTTIVK